MDVFQIATLVAELTQIPGLRLAASLMGDIWNNCELVKTHKEECRELRDRCVRLMAGLEEKCRGAEGTALTTAVDEATAVLQKISRKSHEWTKRRRLIRFFKDDKIERDLGVFNRELTTCIDLFLSSTVLELNRKMDTQTALLLRLSSQSEEHEADLQQMSSTDKQRLMETIYTSRERQASSSEERSLLGFGLHTLYRVSDNVPVQMLDLRGQIKKIGAEPVEGSSSSDVWKGVWLGKEVVAVKLLRQFRITEGRRKRFTAEAVVWRKLTHQNILPFYGIASDQGPSFALISPWIENRDACRYIKAFPNRDRTKLLRGTARGLDYLHSQGVVHGDLRGSNILVDVNGDAKICDFGQAGLLDAATEGVYVSAFSTSSVTAMSARWMAPELFNTQSLPNSRSDVFSYGRVILEILTGQKPFAEERNEMAIPQYVCSQGKGPHRPKDTVVIERGLTDEVWQFLLLTWDPEPSQRPTTAEVLAAAEAFLWTRRPSHSRLSKGGIE